MINRLIGGFVAILLGVVLTGPIAAQTMAVGSTTNATGSTCTYATDSAYAPCAVYMSATWSTTVLRMVPGFFALGILGIGIAVTYGSLKDAGVV